VRHDPFAQIHDHRRGENFPVAQPRQVRDEMATGPSVESQLMETDGISNAVKAGAAAGEKIAEGKVPGVDNYNEEETAKAKKSGTVVSADAGMSWGRGGETETTHERSQETIPPGAASAEGISPTLMTSVSPEPSTLGRPTVPVPAHGAAGNWNMSEISDYKIG
jgi:hypothetical protein